MTTQETVQVDWASGQGPEGSFSLAAPEADSTTPANVITRPRVDHEAHLYNTKFYIDDIINFHVKFGLHPLPPDEFAQAATYRQNFLVEELQEAGVARATGDLAQYLDALVDESYVLLGTCYMMGQHMLCYPDKSGRDAGYLTKTPDEREVLSEPHLPNVRQAVAMSARLYGRLGSAFSALERRDYIEATRQLLDVHRLCVQHAHRLGLDFTEAWNRVHRANMQKERVDANTLEGSKRKNTLDVVKPKGWIPPQLWDLVGLRRPADRSVPVAMAGDAK